MTPVASAGEPDAVYRNRRALPAGWLLRGTRVASGYFAYCCGFWSNFVLQICAQK
jgi:hypothetical protein